MIGNGRLFSTIIFPEEIIGDAGKLLSLMPDGEKIVFNDVSYFRFAYNLLLRSGGIYDDLINIIVASELSVFI